MRNPRIFVLLSVMLAFSACDIFDTLGDRPNLDGFVLVVPGSFAGEADAAASTASGPVSARSSSDNPGGIFEPAREATKIARHATEFAGGLLASFQEKIVENDALWGILVNAGVLEHEDLDGGTTIKLTRTGDDYLLQYWEGDAKVLHLAFSRDGGNWNGSLVASFTPELWADPIMVRVDFDAPAEGLRSSTVSLTGLDGDPAATVDTPNVPVSAVIDLSEMADGFVSAAGTIIYANIFGDDADPLATYYRSFIATGVATAVSEKPVSGAYVYRGRAKEGQAAVDFALCDHELAELSAATFTSNDIASVVEAAVLQYVKDNFPTWVEGKNDEQILIAIETDAQGETLRWALDLENHVYFAEESFLGTDGAATAPAWAADYAAGLSDIPCVAPLDANALSLSMPAAE